MDPILRLLPRAEVTLHIYLVCLPAWSVKSAQYSWEMPLLIMQITHVFSFFYPFLHASNLGSWSRCAPSDLDLAAILPRIIERIGFATPEAGWTPIAPSTKTKSTLHVEDIFRSWTNATSVVDLVNGNGGSFKPTDVPLFHALRAQELADQEVLIDSDANLIRITQIIVFAHKFISVPLKVIRHVHLTIFLLIPLCKFLRPWLWSNTNLIANLQKVRRHVHCHPLWFFVVVWLSLWFDLNVILSHHEAGSGHGRGNPNTPAKIVNAAF